MLAAFLDRWLGNPHHPKSLEEYLAEKNPQTDEEREIAEIEWRVQQVKNKYPFYV